MITKINLKKVLETLGFEKNGNIMYKKYRAYNCELKVDFANEKLIYPVAIRGRERNDNFDAPENFVVFECVVRLLDKGYRPEHIELEKEWHLGHDAKSGRADICVYSPNGSMLFIIECKTYGRSFDKAYRDTNLDGAQLFSYWQQERATKWLILYASDLFDDKIVWKALTINCSDDPNIMIGAKKDKEIKVYSTAHTAVEMHLVWKETYSSKWYDDIVFSEDSRAYDIGVKPLRKKDLCDFAPEDKIVNKFEEILRHNSVSDKENAFNRLVALFICKLVDEIQKADTDEVEFQYKPGTDTYETLQDRLQRLHKEGMETFMREEIFYVSSDYPEQLFKNYTGQNRKMAIADLKEKIRILKFFSNNDFSFRDVHNEELFYQNGKILVEVVQLFQQYRIVYPSKHQFLGDLFEQLLNKGFKQNEGQFFTPIPITRFIWDCLPLERLTHSEKGTVYPKIIDYACGAGHFLTEAVEAINTFVGSDGDNSWARDHIFGVEKDYRLARVAKISMYMNGAGESNIIFGDGLENLPERQVENGSFDILVANPPYSVKDFKQHLKLKNNSFTLLDKIGDNGSEIETLFVERIAQLLKPKGIAAVVLPSSILSNDSASYIGAREHILKNFLIRAIVQFGSKTFGATGTNTVVLFLEKYDEPPKYEDMIQDSATAILSGEDLTDWQDKEILERYVTKIDISEETYVKFTKKELSFSNIDDIEYFKMYLDAFNNSADIIKLKNTKAFKNLSAEEQIKRLLSGFYQYAHKLEFEKILYFALTYTQQTIIITAPSDNAKQKEFLGYDWSNRKGNEGIQIITPGGKMYCDADRKAEDTLASIVRNSFDGSYPVFSEENKVYAGIVNACDMLDFSRLNFNKAISASGIKRFEISTKFPIKLLGKYENVAIMKGKSITKEEAVDGDYKVVAGGVDYAYKHNAFNRSENIITVSASGANAGFVNFWEEKIFASDCTTIQAENEIKTRWLYYYLKSIQQQIFQVLQKGAAQPHVYPEDINRIPVPDISPELQKQIVSECKEIDKKYSAIKACIDSYRREINVCFDDLSKMNKVHKLSVADKTSFDVSIGRRILNSELVSDGTVPVFSANVFQPFGYIDKLLIEDFSKDSVLWGIDGDWMVNFYPKDKQFYPTDHCGVLRVLTDKVHPRYMARLLEIEGEKMKFSRSYRASIDRVEGIVVSVPSIEEQNAVIEKVIELENKIKELEGKLYVLEQKKTEVLNTHLI